MPQNNYYTFHSKEPPLILIFNWSCLMGVQNGVVPLYMYNIGLRYKTDGYLCHVDHCQIGSMRKRQS